MDGAESEFFKSEAEPEDNATRNVKKIVRSNFDSIVRSGKHDVLLKVCD